MIPPEKKHERSLFPEKEKSFAVNLYLFGLTVIWRKGYRSIEIWLGPWGVLFKCQAVFQRGDGSLFRLGIDAGRSYLLSSLFEASRTENGHAYNLELLAGPFGYLVRFVVKAHWQVKSKGLLWSIRIGPDGMLLAHVFRLDKTDLIRFSMDESIGPFRAIARLLIELEWKYKGPAKADTTLLVGHRGYILRAEESVRRQAPGGTRAFFSGSLGPGGAVSRGLIGIDFTSRPIRPYFEFSIGPGNKYGFLYRHSAKDSWINGLDLAKTQDRRLRVIGFDQFSIPGHQGELIAKVVEGVPGFLAPAAPNIRLNIFLGDLWLASTRTDENGWANVSAPNLSPGQYRLAFTRSGDQTPQRSGVSRITVLESDRPVLVLRLEDLVSSGWETAFREGDWNAVETDPKVTQSLFKVSKAWKIIYITRFPIEYLAALRFNLFSKPKGLLPRGMLLPGKSLGELEPFSVLPFPTFEEDRDDDLERMLKEFRFRGIPILSGISHRASDVRMMRNSGLTTRLIPTFEGGAIDYDALSEHLCALVDPKQIEHARKVAADHTRRREASRKDELRRKSFMLECMTGTTLTKGNQLEIFTDPERVVPAIFDAIDRANIGVSLFTMMLGTDSIGTKITDRLIEAGEKSVPARVIVDQWLSEHSETFPNANIERLQNSKVENHVRKLAHGFARVHKKSIITLRKEPDSEDTLLTAFAGGMNWVDASFGNFAQNLGEKKLENPERDLFCRVTGDAARALYLDSLKTWEWATGKSAGDEERQRASTARPDPESNKDAPFSACPLFVIGNIPGQDMNIMYALLSMIACARRHIRIEQNFPPSNLIVNALSDALERGVRVDWIFGARKGTSALLADNLNLNKAAVLFEKGTQINRKENPVQVRIYPITVHMKAMCVDSELFYFGTANLDYVSVEQDAETMLVAPDHQVARWFDNEIFIPDFEKSTPVEYNPARQSLIIAGKEESPLDRVNRFLIDTILPEQIQ